MDMIVERIICAVLGVLLLAGIASGATDLTPSNISNSNTGWLVANGLDSTTITVYVIETPATPVSGVFVDFSLDAASTGMGNFSPVKIKTDANGKATTTFVTANRSGNATILATTSKGATSITLTTFQRINHNTPQYATFIYPATATVGTVAQISIALTDKYNNPIDNNNPADVHPIVLDASSAGGGGFQNGTSYLDHIVLQPNASGKASVNFRLSTIAGQNYFMLQPVGNINEPPLSITGIGETLPAFIQQTYLSSSALPADGAAENYFTIDYIVTDRFGNPCNTTIRFTADDGTTSLKITNPLTGTVRTKYGPSEITGNYTLTWATPSNASVFCIDGSLTGSCRQTVEFYSTTPVELAITANPLTMASLDVDDTSRSVIQAKVLDMKGNPVSGEVVRFSNATPTYPGGPYNETQPLSLSATSATMSGGYATINFTPGRFTTYGNPGYNAVATGQVVLTATWTNKSGVDIKRNIALVWKNYPYLSISSEGLCTNSRVGDTINVTVQVAGDGAALRPKPIDVILVMDKSGSMATALGGSTRMGAAKNAALTFVNNPNLTEGIDRIALVSYSNEDTVSTDASLGSSFANVRTKITAVTPGGSTAMRQGFKQAIDHMIASGRPGAVRAIILMTDGNWNQGGSPLAVGKGYDLTTWVRDNRDSGVTATYYGFSPYATDFEDQDYRWYTGLGGTSSTSNIVVKKPRQIDPNTGVDTAARQTETRFSSGQIYNNGKITKQNMSIYAKENNIRLYTLSFASAIPSDEAAALTTLSTPTGGFYQHAASASALDDLYMRIAGELKDTAGGDTKVALDFGIVNINDQLSSNITNYMDYTPSPLPLPSAGPYNLSDSTYINKSRLNRDGTVTPLYEILQDDTGNWSSHVMKFNVGTVKLNETWFTNFRLKLTKAGKIDLFGPASVSNITFNDSTTNTMQTAFIPMIQCNVLQKQQGVGEYNLSVHDLKDGLGAGDEIFTQWPIQWNTTYDGNETAVEEIKFMDLDIPSRGWQTIEFGWAFVPAKSVEEMEYHTISVTDDNKWPPGDQFCVQITATADDVNGAPMSNTICRTKSGTSFGQYIKLE